MAKIKDATGVSDIQEVVQRFLSQGDTHKHLEQLKINNEKMLARLKEEKVCSLCMFMIYIIVVNANNKWVYSTKKLTNCASETSYVLLLL